MPNVLLTSDQRYEQRKRYYGKHRTNKKNSKKKLTNEELILIYKKEFSDVELSNIINRSVEAIQVARWKIKNNIYIINHENNFIPDVSKSCPCCDDTGKCEEQHYDDIQPCLTCEGSGHLS